MVCMRVGGLSTGDWKNVLIVNNMEQAKACRVNNVYSNLFMVMFKYIPKIKDLIFHKK